MMELYLPINTCALKPRPRKRAQGRAQDVPIRQPRNQNLEQPPHLYIYVDRYIYIYMYIYHIHIYFFYISVLAEGSLSEILGSQLLGTLVFFWSPAFSKNRWDFGMLINIAMENGPLQMVYLLKMVIFHGKLLNNQRVYGNCDGHKW